MPKQGYKWVDTPGGKARVPSGYLPDPENETIIGNEPDANGWIRPNGWLPLDDINPGDHRAEMLVAVFDNVPETYLGFRVGGTGTFTVDWGDGVITSGGAGTTFTHSYTPSTVSASTLTERGYRQAKLILTTTGTLTQIDCDVSGLNKGYTLSNPLLDLHIGAPTLSRLQPGDTTATNYHASRMLEHVKVYSTSSSCELIFEQCTAFRSLETAGQRIPVSSVNFESCLALDTILDIFDFSNCTSLSSSFSDCYRLQTVGIDTSTFSGSMGLMFRNCLNLRNGPEMDTSLVTNMYSMFNGCALLESVPLYDISSVALNATSLDEMFASCNSLRYVPAFNFAGRDVEDLFGSVTSHGNVNYVQTRSLEWFDPTGMDSSNVDLSHKRLSREAIVHVFNNLGTPATTKTIWVNGNPGAAALTSDDLLIATSKNWIAVN